MDDQWYYARSGQQQGPVPSDQLRSLALSGQLSPNDLVWKEGLPNWIEASRVRGLFGEQGDVDLGPTGEPRQPPPAHQQPQYPAHPQPGQPWQGQPQQPIPVGYQTRPLEPAPPNYLVQAILVTVCCCLPFGIVAIVYAAQVNAKHQAGDYAGARDASRKANLWSWIGFGSGLVFGVLYGAVMFLAEGGF